MDTMQSVHGMSGARRRKDTTPIMLYVECEECGFEFETEQRERHICDACRDAMKVKKTARKVQTLLMSEFNRIAAERKGITYNTARYEEALSNSSYEPFSISRTSAMD